MGSMYSTEVMFLGIQKCLIGAASGGCGTNSFYRERTAGMYSPLPYAFALVLVEIPYIFVQAVVYSVIVYSMIGFEWTEAKFFWYLILIYATLLYFTFHGMMTVAATPNNSIATIIEDASMVEVVLVGISSCMDPLWTACFPVWRRKGCAAGYNISVEEFLKIHFGYHHGVVAAVVSGFAILFAIVFAFSIKVFNFQKR